MRLPLLFLFGSTIAIIAACGDDTGAGGGSASELEAACEDFCAAAFGIQCGYLATQTKGFCEAEAASAYQCLANGGFECTGFDSDGDGTEDTFTPTPKSACISEQQAQLTCESEAGCDRFCATADEAGCGGATCVTACETKRDELAALGDSGGCGFAYGSFLSCGAVFGATCEAGTAVPSMDCIDQAFSVGECVQEASGEPGNLCASYCFGAEVYACGASDCDASCAANAADASCGAAWSDMLDCVTFFGDAACEGGMLIASADGICSSEREAYKACAGI
jgi:hypothetical protein